MRQILAFLVCAAFFTSCKKAGDAPPVEKQPTTVAGPDIAIRLPVDSILLDGGRSAGQNNGALNFSWTKMDGPAGDVIVSPHEKSTYVKHLSAGVYHYRLEVCENNSCSKDTVGVTVTANGLPPVAKAGNDTTVVFGDSVYLDGSKSTDPEGNIASYAWKMLDGHMPGNELMDADKSRAKARIFETGTFHFELKVTDSSGKSSQDTVAVSVPNTGGSLHWIIFAHWKEFPGQSNYSLKLVAAIGNKLVGIKEQPYYSQLLIYDTAARTWELRDLSVARINMDIAILGSKVYFMGGQRGGTDPINPIPADTVTVMDIYDVSTGQLTVDHMPAHHGAPEDFAYSTGNFLLIGGAARIDILNTANHSWSSQIPGSQFMLGFDNKIYSFGSTNNVFDLMTNQYSAVSFPPSAQGQNWGIFSATTTNMAFFRDNGNLQAYLFRKGDDHWNMVDLPSPGSQGGPISATLHEVFFWPWINSSVVNIYNEVTNQWTVTMYSEVPHGQIPLLSPSTHGFPLTLTSFASQNDVLYGSDNNNNIYKLIR